MVIYFSGTGNSEYIAELISQKTGDISQDASKFIKNGEFPTFNSDKPYVFVAPVYSWRMPRVFEEWLAECKFEGNKKAYFILTCGMNIGAAQKYLKTFADKSGFDYMGTAEVVMPENYIAMFSAPSKEKSKKIVLKATEKTEILANEILRETPFEKRGNTVVDRFLSGFMNFGFYKFSVSAKKFYVTDKCISCGKCVENCMLNNINLDSSKPVWGNNCTHCMACICKCPTEAIEYGKHTKGLRRYVFSKSDFIE